MASPSDQEVAVPTAFSGPAEVKQRYALLIPQDRRTDPRSSKLRFGEACDPSLPANMRGECGIAAIVPRSIAATPNACGPRLGWRRPASPALGAARLREMTINVASAVLAKGAGGRSGPTGGAGSDAPDLGDSIPRRRSRTTGDEEAHKAKLKRSGIAPIQAECAPSASPPLFLVVAGLSGLQLPSLRRPPSVPSSANEPWSRRVDSLPSRRIRRR